MKDDSNTPGVTIVPPIILFLDDGVNVFASVAQVELELEAIDVRQNPECMALIPITTESALALLSSNKKPSFLLQRRSV